MSFHLSPLHRYLLRPHFFPPFRVLMFSIRFVALETHENCVGTSQLNTQKLRLRQTKPKWAHGERREGCRNRGETSDIRNWQWHSLHINIGAMEQAKIWNQIVSTKKKAERKKQFTFCLRISAVFFAFFVERRQRVCSQPACQPAWRTYPLNA